MVDNRSGKLLIISSPGHGSVVVSPVTMGSPLFGMGKRKLKSPYQRVITSKSGLNEKSGTKRRLLGSDAGLQIQKPLQKRVSMRMHLILILLQFIWGLTFGTIKPYLPIWLRYKGFDTVAIGLVQTIGVCGQFLSPIFGVILDYVRQPALVTMLLCLFAAGLGAAIWLRPDFFCPSGESTMSWSICVFAFLIYGVLTVVIGVFDTINLSWGSRTHFGTYKMFCGIGWGIACPIIGYFGEGSKISIMFPALVFCCLVMAFVLFILTLVTCRNPPKSSGESGESIMSQLRVFFTSLDRKSYFVIANFLFGGACFAGIQLYLFLWLQDLGGSNFLMGLTMVITILGEAPCFYVYVRVLQRHGPKRILGIGSLAYIVRMVWYTLLGLSWLKSPWFVFVVEMLHGLTFAWMFGSCSVYAYLISTPDIRNTAVQFLSTVYMGAGGVLGSSGCGVIYQYYGGRAVFIVLSCTMVPFAIYGLFSKRDHMPPDFFGDSQPEERDEKKTALLN